MKLFSHVIRLNPLFLHDATVHLILLKYAQPKSWSVWSYHDPRSAAHHLVSHSHGWGIPGIISITIPPRPEHSRGPYTHYHSWGSWKPLNDCLLPSQVLLEWAWRFPGPVVSSYTTWCVVTGRKRGIITRTVKTIQLLCRDTKPTPYSSISSFPGAIPYPWFFFSCYQFSIIPLPLTFRVQWHLHFKRKLPGHFKATRYSLAQQSDYHIYLKIMNCSAISG